MLPSSTGETDLTFTPDSLQNLFIMTALILSALWFFSLFGEERRNSTAVISEPESGSTVWADLRLVWNNAHLRYFLFYLALSMIFAFAQDLVLEPFAGDVFGMEARVTTRFAAYWGSMSILGSVLFLVLSRRFKALNNTVMSVVGVVTLIVTFIVFGISALVGVRALVTPGLILLGLGLGLWNIGTLGLMMDMSPAERAGTFLGFWTLVVTFARGFGVSGGGILRDLILSLTGSLQVAYGGVFVLEIIGLALALWALRMVNVRDYQAEKRPADTAAVLAGALD
jgi:BCD family chlorophyll transporter-like MFS transporter